MMGLRQPFAPRDDVVIEGQRGKVVRLTVAPETDLSGALAVGLDVLRGMRGVLGEPPPSGRVVEVGDSWVGLMWLAWMNQTRTDFEKVRSEAIRLVLEGLASAGVDMPPPEHRVRLLREGGGPAASEPPPTPEPGTAAQLDVSVDTSLDEQIAADRRASDETDLLESGDS